MPGHKRNPEAGELARVCRLDITEIDGFDDLHHPKGVLKDLETYAANLMGAKKAFLLVNGSTVGILASICGTVSKGSTMIVARGCHKSVYHGAYLQDAELVFLKGTKDPDREPCSMASPIEKDEVAEAMDLHPEAKVVVITSPTYEGICSDVRAIAEQVHKRGGILIVDQAHGAHFGLSPECPESAASQGADLVIVSLHKTLPCMTQTALLLQTSDRVPEERLRLQLSVLQTSSPSYVLMASIEEGLKLSSERKELFREWKSRSDKVKRNLAKCRYLYISKASHDPGRIVIGIRPGTVDGSGTFYTGKRLANDLRTVYHMEPELTADTYVIAIMTIMDTSEGWDRLERAILEIDSGLSEKETRQEIYEMRIPEAKCSLRKALDGDRESVPLAEAIGRVSAGFLWVYPPGVPEIIPGEPVDEHLVERIQKLRLLDLNLQGIDEEGKIEVLSFHEK